MSYPGGLDDIIDLFEILPEVEKRETLITYAEGSDKCAPVEGEEFELEGFGVRYPDGRSGSLIVHIDASSGGVAATQNERGGFSGLVDILDDEDVEVIPTVGTVFDSSIHEVVGKVDGGPGVLVVTGEIRRGYRVRGQVIRPALVTVQRKDPQL